MILGTYGYNSYILFLYIYLTSVKRNIPHEYIVEYICRTYPTKMKLDTVMPYLKKTQKTLKSHDKPICILVHNF